jgi:hypothetical protein
MATMKHKVKSGYRLANPREYEKHLADENMAITIERRKIFPHSRLAKVLRVLVRTWQKGGGEVNPQTLQEQNGISISDAEFIGYIRELEGLGFMKHVSGATSAQLGSDETGVFEVVPAAVRAVAELDSEIFREMSGEE